MKSSRPESAHWRSSKTRTVAAGTGDRNDVSGARLRGGVEEVLQQPELPAAADERRLQPGGAERPAATRDDPVGAEQRDRLRLSLQLVDARVLVRDRGVG